MPFGLVLGRTLERDERTPDIPELREHPTTGGRTMFTPTDSDPDFPVEALEAGEWLSGPTVDLRGWA
ncbi:hypothetical protein G9C85_02505 [Halorubellus sp. JP-L1]|uniref:hypothetical protein n=1 Tax=Halorubellus sp. JP-L1 TaxID=2715753 RepID=UPI00140DF184|nr:hypothetical protein [Halorubellus sp. JP-L1]NHN40509.1 hypothetical protein [Halorubellus sp. JP-L1]